jgi:hypothetical protein
MRNAALAVAVLALAVALVPIADAKKKPPGSGNGNSGAASWPIQTPRGHRAATAHRLASAPDEDGDWTDQAQKDEPRVTGRRGSRGRSSHDLSRCAHRLAPPPESVARARRARRSAVVSRRSKRRPRCLLDEVALDECRRQ